MKNEIKIWLADKLLSGELGNVKMVKLIEVARKNPAATIGQLEEHIARSVGSLMSEAQNEIGRMIVYGNIWSRIMAYKKEGDMYAGHKHYHDHITLIAKGAVLVLVEGYEPQEFIAPNWIIIPNDHEHQFIAIEDDTICYCIHAIRDNDGEPNELYDTSNIPHLTPIKNGKIGLNNTK